MWTGVAVAVVAFVLMEPLTAASHRWVMHGVGLGLHRSHHRRVRPGESPRRWEANDAYPVMFAAIVMMGFAVGFNVAGFAALVPAGIGVTAYGLTYALVHDVYIHRRLPLFGERSVPGLAPPTACSPPSARRSNAAHRPSVCERSRVERGSTHNHRPAHPASVSKSG
jgi:hypothetical protein